MLSYQWCLFFHMFFFSIHSLDYIVSHTYKFITYFWVVLCAIVCHHTCYFLNIEILYVSSYSIYFSLKHTWNFTFARQKREEWGEGRVTSTVEPTELDSSYDARWRSKWKTDMLPGVQRSPKLIYCMALGFFGRTMLLDKKITSVAVSYPIMIINLLNYFRDLV